MIVALVEPARTGIGRFQRRRRVECRDGLAAGTRLGTSGDGSVRIVIVLGLLCSAVVQAQAKSPSQPHNLECSDIRRLSDNFLLDLRIRMIFSRPRHAYVRLENTGRGWHVIAERQYVAFEPTRIVLAENPSFITYIERLTGNYYHIDNTGTGLSVWGRCAQVGGLYRLF